jgi:hypothetical protein
VPAETSVYRGSLLNLTQDVKVIHPVTKQLIDLEKHPVRTYGLVADLLGGGRFRCSRRAAHAVRCPPRWWCWTPADACGAERGGRHRNITVSAFCAAGRHARRGHRRPRSRRLFNPLGPGDGGGRPIRGRNKGG